MHNLNGLNLRWLGDAIDRASDLRSRDQWLAPGQPLPCSNLRHFIDTCEPLSPRSTIR